MLLLLLLCLLHCFSPAASAEAISPAAAANTKGEGNCISGLLRASEQEAATAATRAVAATAAAVAAAAAAVAAAPTLQLQGPAARYRDEVEAINRQLQTAKAVPFAAALKHRELALQQPQQQQQQKQQQRGITLRVVSHQQAQMM